MKRLALLIVLAGAAPRLAAQSCDEAKLATEPGIWKPGVKTPTTPVAPADLTRERAVIDKIHAMVQKNYHPVGLAALWSGNFGFNPGADQYFANPYYYAVFFFKYWCKLGVPMLNGEGESPTSLFVFANSTEWISYVKGAVPAQKKFIGVRSMGQERNGVVEFDLSGEGGPGLKRTGWLVTYPGKLPYRPVSRKAYLEFAKGVLSAKIAASTSPEYYKRSLAAVDKALAAPAGDLAQQAIVNIAEIDGGTFTGFRPLATGRLLVELNPDYFDRKLPKSAPQFFAVFLNVPERVPVYRAAADAVRKAVDFEGLRALLGK